MVTLVQIVGVLGFVLSVINLGITIYSRRASLLLKNCLLLPANPGSIMKSCILDATIVNCSGLPISIYDLRLGLSSEEDVAPAERRSRISIRTVKNGQDENDSVYITSSFPINLNPYESKRIAVLIPPHNTLQEVFRLVDVGNLNAPVADRVAFLPDGASAYYYAEMCTSRRKRKTVPFSAGLIDSDDWYRTARAVD